MADHHSLLPDEQPSSRRPLPDGFLARLEALGVAPQVHNSARHGPSSRAIMLGVAACCALILTATAYYGLGSSPSEPQASTAQHSTPQQTQPAADTVAVTQTPPAEPPTPSQHAQPNEQPPPAVETGSTDSLEQAFVKASAPPRPDASAATTSRPKTAAADQGAGALNADPADDIIDFSLPDLLTEPTGSGWNGQVFGHISGIDWPTVAQRNKTAARNAAAARQRRDSDTALIELLLRQSE